MSQNGEEKKSKEEIIDSQSNPNIETEQPILDEKNENNENNENNEINENNESKENNENKATSQNQNGTSEQNNFENNNYDYEKNKKEIMDKIELRKYQADVVEKYINETGIGTAFQIIFSELLSKKIPVDNYYNYTASRLRQIGREKAAIDRKNKKNKKK